MLGGGYEGQAPDQPLAALPAQAGFPGCDAYICARHGAHTQRSSTFLQEFLLTRTNVPEQDAPHTRAAGIWFPLSKMSSPHMSPDGLNKTTSCAGHSPWRGLRNL